MAGDAKVGTVFLVGAGPGDPGLLTVRGAECLKAAEVIVADHLVDPEVIARHASPEAEVITRPPRRAELDQEEINRLLIDKARAGKTVVRLKGGDPFIFGRGGEEAQALSAANIPFQVVPGVPAAIAVSAYAGIPLTHRGAAASVAFATGHEADLKSGGQVAWDALSRGASTLVLYMSVKNLSEVVTRLLAAGRPSSEPIAVIENGTTSNQRTLISTLDRVVDAAHAMNLSPPALTLVGEVVNKGRVSWFESQPLHGKRVLVVATKSPQIGRRPDGLEVLWVRPLTVVPCLAAAALENLSRAKMITFASTHAVDALFSALKSSGKDARALGAIKIAAVGKATEARLLDYGLAADLTGDEGGASLAQKILAAKWDGPALVLGAQDGRPDLAHALASGGVSVESMAAYETAFDRESLGRVPMFDAIAFGSPKGVHAFLAQHGRDSLATKLVGAIGQTTASALGEAKISAAVICERPEIEMLVDEIAEALAAQRKLR